MAWVIAVLMLVSAGTFYWFELRRQQEREKALWDKLDELMKDNKILTEALLRHSGVPVVFKPVPKVPSEGWFERKDRSA